jgi:GTPase SAR1 family protein
VLLVAFDDAPELVEVGSSEAAAKELRVHFIKSLAGSYACLFKEVGTTRAKALIEAVSAVSTLVDELVGKVNKEGGEDVKKLSHSADIAFVGSIFTGKSALVSRLVTGLNLSQYTHTTMLNVLNLVHVVDDQEWKLKLIDTASVCGASDVDAAIPRETAKKLSAYVLVFSVRDIASFRLLAQLPQLLQRASGKKLPMLVVGTNADESVMRVVSRDEASAFCDAVQLPFVEVSCLSELTSASTVLTPLLKRIGEAGSVVHIDSTDMSLQGSVAAWSSTGILFLRDASVTGKKFEWIKMQAEMKRDLLLLVPLIAEEEEKCLSPPPQVKDERRFSGILSSIRRRSLLKSSKEALLAFPPAAG